MACIRCLAVFVALLTLACDAVVVTDAQEETCAGEKQLMQARTKLHSEDRETENTIADPEETKNKEEEEGAHSPKCPWHVSEGLGCARGDMAVCADGTRSWRCNLDGHGARVQCPCNLPLMCAEAACGGGADYCCERDCSNLGGLRPCEGKQEEEPTEEPVTPKEERPPTPAPLPPLKWIGENPGNNKLPLALCEGDCDTDQECAGGLKCFQRDGYTTPPGCDGLGEEAFDYCYDPEGLGLPKLQKIGKNPGNSKLPLDVCSGDCDSDAECKEGLVCYQRTGKDTVPGCDGEGTKDWDYCIEDETDYARELADKGIDPTDSLERCTGDCDKDADCVGNLKCFERNGFTPVPHCLGTGKADWDYCYDSKEPELQDVAITPTGPLEVCHGDCDKDADCEGGLKCFQRDGTKTVPGCLGKGKADWDYCIE